jgi:ABC-type multidrug transport system ATPase subunit
MNVYLEWLEGPRQGKRETLLWDEVYLGRDKRKCQIAIDDDLVSRCHAVVREVTPGRYEIQDLASRNGTFVNGQLVTGPQELKPGVVISLGRDTPIRLAFQSEVVQPVAEREPPRAPDVEATPLPVSPDMTQVAVGAAKPARASFDKTVVEPPTAKLGPSLCCLQYVIGHYVASTLDLRPGRTISVGRSEDNTLPIDEPTISRTHVEILVQEDGTAHLVDLHSDNGTFVNGERLPPGSSRQLMEGDRLRFGEAYAHTLIYREPSPTSLDLPVEHIQVQPGGIFIGRGQENDRVLDHPLVSRVHAKIESTPTGYRIIDCGSTNGTFVNGKPVTEAWLEDNDQIRIGPYVFRFQQGELAEQFESRAVRLDVVNLSKVVRSGEKKQTLRLLDDVSLTITPREFVGIIGPSGAGKSTFMNAVMRPAAPGQIYFGGMDLKQNLESLKSLIGYVPQEDSLHLDLTAFDGLYYAAKLRLPPDTSEVEIRKSVQDILQLLDLWDKRDTLVRQLSGGQRKRVSVGMELVAKPAILFLDEPTAGLDPSTEAQLMELFRRIANHGCTVVCTTHLLGSFALFDKVVVLVRGKLAYFGPGTEFFSYFEESLPEVIYRKLSEQKTPDAWQEQFHQSQYHEKYVQTPQQELEKRKARAPSPTQERKPAPRSEKPSTWRQFLTLTRRYGQLKLGDPSKWAPLFLPVAFVALLVRTMVEGPNLPKALFMVVFAALWFGCSSSVREIVDEGPIFRRERLTGLGILSYVGSKLAVLWGIGLLQSLLFVGLLYVSGAIGGHFLLTVLLMFLVSVTGVLIGLGLSAWSKTAEQALWLFPLLVIPQLLFAGLLIPVEPIRLLVPISNETVVQGLNLPPEAAHFKGIQGVEVKDEFYGDLGRYLALPQANQYIKWLSAPMVSRWALETLAHVFVHDPLSPTLQRNEAGYYQYKLYNTIHFSLHNDQERNALADSLKREVATSLPLAAQWSDRATSSERHLLVYYLAILAVLVVLKTSVVLWLVTRRAQRMSDR